MNTNWTKKEFKAYVFLYAAQINFIETKEEQKLIMSKIGEKVYNSIHNEIVHDSDFDRVKKIENYLKSNSFSQEDKQKLIKEVKEVFFADGSVDFLEKNVFQFLKRVLG